MPRLRCLFKYELPDSVLIEYRERETILRDLANAFDSLAWGMGDFEVELSIAAIGDSAKSVNGGETWVSEVNTLEILVSRDETEELPITEPDEQGRVDLRPLQSFLDGLRTEYMRIASGIVVKFMLYLKYESGHPIVNTVPSFAQTEFENPKWFSEDGEQIWGRVTYFSSNPGLSMKLFPDCGVTPLKSITQDELLTFLNAPRPPELFEEILGDARIAIAEGNTRRAILEMAIACEVGTKQIVSGSESYKSSVIDQLSESKLMNASNLDYIDKIPTILYGHSIKHDDKISYLTVKCLYKCRNSVVHEGKPQYKDDMGRVKNVDREVLIDMWNAVNQVIYMLKKYASKE